MMSDRYIENSDRWLIAEKDENRKIKELPKTKEDRIQIALGLALVCCSCWKVKRLSSMYWKNHCKKCCRVLESETKTPMTNERVHR